jgi:transglutaminase-like putative cysteine protease
VMMTMTMMSVPFTITLSDRDRAMGGAATLPPEMMARTFIKSDKRIAAPRSTRRAEYLLSVPEGDMPTIPATGTQRVEDAGERTMRVIINADDGAPAPENDRGNPVYLESSSMLNARDPQVAALMQRAVRSAGDDPVARAEAMRRFVYRHIRQKDLDVGFATASEVARSRRGDCTEHGVLLAAMLRADGIPARVVSGLVYADRFAGEQHIFGYHMWTQALLEINGKPAWVDLDATLREVAFDATHIALMVSALRDGEAAASMSALIPLIGRLEVRIESIR